MSTLTGQQIKDTYEGLLKLDDSTTGITSTYQQIQDGLGNNTNTRISSVGIQSPTLVGMNINTLAPDALGTGASAGALTPGAGSQSNLLFSYFYDTGVYSYSSITVNVTTITSTSDVVELLFYDLQQVNQYGLFPRNQILSGITLPASATGYQTITLPSTLSFSGTGAGYYAYVLKYTNGGSTPSVRYGTSLYAINNQSYLTSFGVVRNNAGTAYLIGNRAQSFTGGNLYWFSNQSTPATITPADVATRFNTTVVTGTLGFNLNVIK